MLTRATAALSCSGQTHAMQSAKLQLLRELFLAISDGDWSGKTLPSSWPPGVWVVVVAVVGSKLNTSGGNKLAEMWFQRQKFSMCGAVGLRLFIILQDRDGRSFCDILALIWRWTAEKGSTYGWTDLSTLPGSDSKPLYCLKVMSGTFCECASEFGPTGIVHIVFTVNDYFHCFMRKKWKCMVALMSYHILTPNQYMWFAVRLFLLDATGLNDMTGAKLSALCQCRRSLLRAPALYLWASLGPALLIIHETLTGHNRSQHQTGSLSQPVVKKNFKNKDICSVFCWIKWQRWENTEKSTSRDVGFTTSLFCLVLSITNQERWVCCITALNLALHYWAIHLQATESIKYPANSNSKSKVHCGS